MGNADFTELNRTLSEILGRASDLHEPLSEIGMLMVGEMQQNFEVGGRPERWPKSIRVKKTGGQTLRDTGVLMNSLTFVAGERSVVAGPGSGAGVKARVLAFGATIRAKSKTYLRFRIPGVGWVSKKEVTIPARDYTFIPEETGETFGQIVADFMMP